MLSSHHPRGGVQPASGEGLEDLNCHLKNLSSEDLSSTAALKMCEGSELIHGGQKIIEITSHPSAKGHVFSVHAQSRLTLWTPWTVAHQAPLSLEFSRQEYWSGLPFPTPGYLPSPGIEPESPALAGRFFTTMPSGDSHS